MDTRIQDLTDKIYSEGIEKAEKEAEKIITAAKEKNSEIINEAEAKATQIVSDAEKNATALKKNTEAELKLFATQALEALKSEIVDLITGKIVSDNVKSALADSSFMQKTILETAKEWTKKEDVVIQTSEAKALSEYFESNAKSLLDKGITIEQVNGRKASFTLAPSDGSYKISFGEEEFTAYFREFLRPKLIEMLF